MKADRFLHLVALLAGAAIWIAISAATGRREAWDSGAYFSVGMPAVCVLSFVLGFARPARSWRWGVLPMAGQFAWMLVSQGPGNLLPLGIVMFGVLSIPAIVTARVGAAIGVRRAQAEEP